MNQPLKVLCELGGWKTAETVLQCYQRANEDRLRKPLENRRRAHSGHNWREYIAGSQTPKSRKFSRGARIRTGDLLLPKQDHAQLRQVLS